MRLKKLTVEGFESAASRVEVNFEGKDMVAFVGENGSGKSMLSIWAIVFALYGKVRARTISEAISTSTGQAYVELEFSANGNNYRIIRKLPRIGRQEAVLYVYDDALADWTPLTEKEVKSTNQAIIDVVGMDYEGARTTFIAEQGKYGMFCEGTPMERRNILTQLLNLEGYEELREAADTAYKAALVDIASSEASLSEMETMREVINKRDPKFESMSDEDLDDELAELHEKDAEAQRKEAEIAFERDNAQSIYDNARAAVDKFYRDRDDKVASIERNIASLRRVINPARIASIEADLARVDDGRMALAQLEPKIADRTERISKGKESIRQDEATLEQMQEQASAKKSEESVTDAALAELTQQEADLKKSQEHGAVCTTCSQPLTPTLLDTVLEAISHKREVLNQRKQALAAELTTMRSQFVEVKKNLKTKQDWLEKYTTELSQFQQNKAGIEQILNSESRLRQSLADAQQEQTEAQTEIEFLNDELNERKDAEAPQEMVDAIAKAKKHLDETINGAPVVEYDSNVRMRIAELEREVANRENARAKEAAFDERKKVIEVALADARANEESYGVLRKAFAPTGIPAMIMAGALQELEDDANHYLDKFSKGTLSLNIETQKETQKGKINEEILVTINAPDGTRDYASFSGGQKFRIDLSIRIAMCKVSARRNGTAAVETLFVDEGFGALDETGKLSTLGALTELSEEMAVIAVSHIDSVKDGFPNLMEVSLETGTTTVKEVRSAA